MGVIYSYSNLKSREVPNQATLKKASEHTLTVLEGLIEQGHVTSGMIYGGGARGEGRVTSDIDAFVRYNNLSALAQLRNLSLYVEEHFSGAVLDFCLLFDEFAHTPFRRENTTLIQHLLASPGHDFHVGPDPLEGIWLPTQDKNPLIYNAMSIGFYFDGTARTSVDFRGEESYRDFLKKVKERYKFIVREAVMIARSGKPPIEKGKGVDDNKGLIDYFVEDFEEHTSVLGLLEQLIESDRAHDLFVDGTQSQERELDKRTYDIELARIGNTFPVFMQFTMEVIRILINRHFSYLQKT